MSCNSPSSAIITLESTDGSLVWKKPNLFIRSIRLPRLLPQLPGDIIVGDIRGNHRGVHRGSIPGKITGEISRGVYVVHGGNHWGISPRPYDDPLTLYCEQVIIRYELFT